jgi:phage repressor protein C with HTH and peptisase S24 domain
VDIRGDMTGEKFAKLLGISYSYLTKLETGALPLSAKVSKNLAKKLKLAGLLTETNQVNEPLIKYAIPKPVTTQIPYFDVDVMATPIEVFNDQTTRPSYQIDMPGFQDCDFAINVFGHSMYPTIESGMIAICKKISDKTLILYGEIYFIVTDDFRMVKRILKGDRKGYIIAASDNHNGHSSPDGKTYAPVEIPIEKIRHLYVVKGIFKRCLI